MPELTQQRLAELARWLAASRDRFTDEAKLAQAASGEIKGLNVEELELIKQAWTEGAAIPTAVDQETGEILEEDIPFVAHDSAGDDAAETGAELVAVDGQLVSLFGRVARVQVALQQVEEHAEVFKQFAVAHDLALEMEDGSLYVLQPGVEAGGQLTGVFAEILETEPYKDGWKARACWVKPATGERGGSHDAICLRSEIGRKWKPENELLQMAQTRASRKALASAISIIWTAGGFNSAPPNERPATPAQRKRLYAVLAQLESIEPRGKDGWKDFVTRGTIKRWGVRISGLNVAQMTTVIEGMQQRHEQLQGGAEPEPDEVEGYQPTEEELAEADSIEF